MAGASDPDFERPVPVLAQPPGGAVVPFVEPPEAISAEQLAVISREYIHGSKRVDSIAVDLGLSTRDVRQAIRRYGFDKRKAEIVAQVQQEELAAYSKFLLDNRVSAAEQHLRISNSINRAVEAIVDKAGTLTPEELAENLKPLKDAASLFRSLSETLAASSGVGARAVSLSGLADVQGGGLALAAASGKRPLVSLSFNVAQAPPAPPAPIPVQSQPESIDAEFEEVPK